MRTLLKALMLTIVLVLAGLLAAASFWARGWGPPWIPWLMIFGLHFLAGITVGLLTPRAWWLAGLVIWGPLLNLQEELQAVRPVPLPILFRVLAGPALLLAAVAPVWALSWGRVAAIGTCRGSPALEPDGEFVSAAAFTKRWLNL